MRNAEDYAKTEEQLLERIKELEEENEYLKGRIDEYERTVKMYTSKVSLLETLQEHGVDNWSGYGYALTKWSGNNE